MYIIKPPTQVPLLRTLKVFLAGSIEMGAATNWQPELTATISKTEELMAHEVMVLNPRRDDWDSSWVQSIHSPEFKGQVEWELDGIEQADIVVFYFDPATKSPISLLELGLTAHRQLQEPSWSSQDHRWVVDSRVLVCCPDGFWRKGNVDIVCLRYGIPVLATFDGLVKTLKNNLLSAQPMLR